MRKWFSCILCLLVLPVFAQQRVVNVFNWSGYIPQNVLTLFQKETGIHINYSTFESNEALYTKLKTDPTASYDVVVPTSYIVQQMREEGMLRKIDKSKLSNFKHLNRELLNKSYDPHNRYSIPYLWGTTGIILNKAHYPKGTITTWKDLWKPIYRNKVTGNDSMRDWFGIGMKSLGYSINDTNPKHIAQAYQKLLTLMPNVLAFEPAGGQQMYVNEDSNLGIIDSGDAMLVRKENPNYYFVYPKDGAIIWVDSMVIPRHAQHIKEAYAFINFVLRPDVAKMISEGVGYSSPNASAVKLMSKKMQNNRIINPTDEDLRHAEVEGYMSKDTLRLFLKYWELLKLNG